MEGTIFIIIGAIQASFFMVLLLSKAKKNGGDFILAGFLATLFIHLLYYYFSFEQPESLPFLFGILGFSLVILHTPLYFLYLKSLMFPRSLKPKTIWIHALPYLILNILFFIAYFRAGTSIEPKLGFLLFRGPLAPLLSYSGLSLAFITIGYILWGGWMYYNYRRRLLDHISQIEAKHQRWIQFLLGAFIIYFLLIYFIITINLQSSETAGKTFIYVSIVIMLMIFLLGFVGLKQQFVFFNPMEPSQDQPNPASTQKYEKSGLSPEEVSKFGETITEKLSNGQWYTNDGVSLAIIAKDLSISPTYLSQVINQHFDCNFYDLINSYRIESVKEKLKDPAYTHLSILGIAMECGFNSKSSFNTAFKKFTGMTPSAYRNQQP